MRGSSASALQRTAELEQIVEARWSVEAFRRFQCIWLSEMLNLPAREIAGALGLSLSTIHRLRAEFRRDGGKAIDGKGNRGGRRNHYMTFEEEADFLRDHEDLFTRQGTCDIHLLKAAFETVVGGMVHKTTMYRLLERHGRMSAANRSRNQGGEPGPLVRTKNTGTPRSQRSRKSR